MVRRLKSWLATPDFEGDEYKTYQATLLNQLVLSLLFGGIGLLIISIIFIPSAKIESGILIIVSTITLLACKTQINRGHLQGVSFFLLTTSWVLSTLIVLFSGGISNVSMIYYVTTIIIATIFFGWRGAMIVTIITALTTLCIVITSIKGYMPSLIFTAPPISSWMVLLFALIVITIVLNQAIDSRDKVLIALRESEQKYRALYEAESDAIILTDRENGKIVDVNKAAIQLYGYSREEMIGKSLFELCAEQEIAQIEISEPIHQHLFHYHRRKDGSTFPTEINNSIFTLKRKNMDISAIRDVSKRLNIEARLRAFSQGFAGIITAADELIRCNNLDEVCQRAVVLGQEKLGLERCAIFLSDSNNEFLMGTYGTDAQGQLTDEHTLKSPVSDHPELSTSNEGLWTVVHGEHSYWKENKKVHVGSGWVISTVIRNAGQPIGIFFNDSAISNAPIDDAQQETVSVYCSLLGNIIERKRAEQRERKLSQGLKTIIDIADELINCTDLQSLYRKAVELAREELGIERCGLFLHNTKTNSLQGTYGTDMMGNTTSEFSISWESDFSDENEKAGGNETWYVSEGQLTSTEGNKQIPVGQGWIAHTILKLGQEPIGLFTNDTAITHKSLDRLQQELIAIYCSLLGNIIKNKKAEEAIKKATLATRASEARYRRAIEAAGAVPYLIDYTTQAFVFIGENIEQLTGYPTKEFTLAFWDSLIEDAIQEEIAGNLSKKETHPLARTKKNGHLQCDYLIHTRQGEKRWVMDNAIEILDEDGNVRGSIGILQDITERKQTEAELGKLIAELETKNAELERFTYTVSHDLKAPLITIKGFLGYLEKDIEQGNQERLQVDIERITDATIRMQELLNDLLELSRIGRIVNPPKFIPFELLIEEALRLVQGRLEANHVTVIVSDSLPHIYGDSARIVEVVQNLVDNAAKFSSELPKPRIEIGYTQTDARDFHTFYVRDNGPGIDPRFHERIFGLFDKLDPKSEGTGVGLAIVKRIIELHGGKIWVESEGWGNGTTFFFTLPGKKPKT